MKKHDELIQMILAGLGLLLILYLFYKSVWAFVLIVPGLFLYRKNVVKRNEQKRTTILNSQFKDMLDSLAAALRTGYSMENAVAESAKELRLIYGEDSLIYKELTLMIRQLNLHLPIEQVFSEFVQRNRTEDIELFVSVFYTVQRTGGDLVEIIQSTADDIAGKQDTRDEISVLISAKRLEHRIMSLIPIGIILYMDLTSDGLLKPLYHNLTGVLIMTLCLTVYVCSAWLGEKIMGIEV